MNVSKTPSNELVYEYTYPGGKKRRIPTENVLHIKGLPYNGLTGASPLTHARESFGLGIAAQNYGSTFFGNSAMPKSMVVAPASIPEKDREAFSKKWLQKFQSAKNKNKTAFAFGDWDVKTLSLPPNDAQFLETRRLSREDIAAIFGVPQHKAGILDNADFSNITQQSVEANVDAIGPRVRRIEQQLNRTLLTAREREQGKEIRFNMDALLRGDPETRNKAFQAAVITGWMSRNEVRDLNGLPSADGLDEYLVPVNMAPASKLLEQPQPKDPIPKIEEPDPDGKTEKTE